MKSALFALVLAVPGYAWDLAYTATIDSNNPRYALPSEDLTFVYSGGGRSNVRYTVMNFVAPLTGLYLFSSVTLTNWDNYLVLYRGAFNPNQPLTNAVVANDNNPTVGRSGFSATLTGGEQYFVVTSAAFNGGGFRQAANTISSAVPEPSTWLLCGGALVALARSRRRRVTAVGSAPQSPQDTR